MSEMLRKQFACTFKATDLNDGIFEGHASIFNVPDDGMPPDIMVPGAFKKTIAEMGPNGANRIKILALHRTDWLPIGRPLELYEDDRGLFFRGKISPTTLGNDVMTLMRDNVLTEMSIGFKVVKYEVDQRRDVRTLQEVKLWEISPVTWAMHPQAKIAAVKELLSLYSADVATLAEDPEVLQQLTALLVKLKPVIATSSPTAADPVYDPELLQSLQALTAQVKAAIHKQEGSI